MIEVKINPDELPNGHAVSYVVENHAFYVGLGGGHGYGKHGNVLVANFKQLGLYVIAGQSLIDTVSQEEDKTKWGDIILNATMKYLADTKNLANTIAQIADNARIEGIEFGKKETQSRLREALGICQ